MVFALATLATLLSSWFAMATGQRAAAGRGPHQAAWTVALVLFALASLALAIGSSTGFDPGTYRVFYTAGAVCSVPWLALGTVFLLLGGRRGRVVRAGLLVFTGMAVGTVFSTPLRAVSGTAVPVGQDVFVGAGPRVLAAIGSGLGATVIVVGALVSMVRLLADREAPGRGRLAASNALVALGTLVLSSGGLVQGFLGHDEAFAASLALGIAVIYSGFLVADGVRRRPVPVLVA